MISSFSWVIVTLLFGIVFLGVSFTFEQLEKKDLSKTVETQQDAVKALLDQINIRYNDAQLVKEIGQATSMLLDTERLLKAVVDAMQNRLDFDRGGIWLANREKSRLVYRVGFGYNAAVEEVLKKTDFHLDKPHSRGVAVQSFREQRPFLVNDVREIEKDISERSYAFIREAEHPVLHLRSHRLREGIAGRPLCGQPEIQKTSQPERHFASHGDSDSDRHQHSQCPVLPETGREQRARAESAPAV